MRNNYNEAYKDYYDKVRNKVKSKEDKINNEAITKDFIYPSTSNVGSYTYRRGSPSTTSNKKKFKYLDRFILKLIITFMLFLGVFTLKILPNEEAKELYKIFKTTISSNFDYKKLEDGIESLGFNYSDIKNNVEEKYNQVINLISDMNFDDINEASNL